MSLDERELAIHPIVTESVQHNARVSPFTCVQDPPYRDVYPYDFKADMRLATDRLEHSCPDCVAVRSRRWNSGFGIVAGLRVLLPRHSDCLLAHLLAQGRPKGGGVLFQALLGPLGGRHVRRSDVVCPYVDVVLRTLQGLSGSRCFGGLDRSITGSSTSNEQINSHEDYMRLASAAVMQNQ